jgi:hypothetical protein
MLGQLKQVTEAELQEELKNSERLVHEREWMKRLIRRVSQEAAQETGATVHHVVE